MVQFFLCCSLEDWKLTYRRYVVLAVLGTSTGLVVGGHAVDRLEALKGWSQLDAYRMIFWIYTGVGCVKAIMVLFLSRQCERADKEETAANGSSTDEREPLLNGHAIAPPFLPGEILI